MYRLILSILALSLYLGLYAQSYPDFNPIKIDQFGYLPDAKKVAVISNPQIGADAAFSYTPGSTLEVKDQNTNQTVFSAAPASWNNGNTHFQSGDQVWWFDFTSLNTPGDYYIFDPSTNQASYTFTIAEDVYKEVLKQAVRTFFYQRSGFAKDPQYAGNWSDAASHLGPQQDLQCTPVIDPYNTTLVKDLSGGWFDAGDYNKYTNFTRSTLHDLIFAFEQNPEAFTDDYNIPESGNGIPDIIDEIKFEMDWLIKMQNADGSVLNKVSVTDFAGASPPSNDTAPRRYGRESISSTLTLAGVFAHFAKVINDNNISQLSSYASDLSTRAENAWNWYLNNPNYPPYDNAGFQSAGTEDDETQIQKVLAAACMLYALTGDNSYKTFVETNYLQANPLSWYYFYPFQQTMGNCILYYSVQPGVDPAVAQEIQSRYLISLDYNNPDLMPAYYSQNDAYMAQMKDGDYVWGSNSFKSMQGQIIYNALHYQLDPANDIDFRDAAAGYIHNMHGVNPMDIVYLSNMYDFGAEHSVNEFYHGWFYDGSIYDNVWNSSVGPAPGYVVGGPNPGYTPEYGYISPPQGQPIQKSYQDWNTSWPENSWEITENAIYYQAAYIHLLSNFIGESDCNTTAEITNAPNSIISSNPVALNATPPGGTFSGPGIVFNAFNPALSGPGLHSITYTFDDGNNCVATDQVTILVGTITYNFVNYNLGTISPQ